MANEIVVQNSPVTTRLMSRRRRDRRGRHGAVRREIRRRGARRVDGHRPAWREGQPALFGRTVRRHACRRAPATSACSRSSPTARVAAGVRRIEALTGEAARRHLDEQDRAAEGGGGDVEGRARPMCSARVEALLDERKQARARTVRGPQEAGAGRRRVPRPTPSRERDVAGVGFLGKSVTGVAPKDLKSLADAGKTSLGSGVVVFVGAGEDGKASVVVGVTDDLTARFSAVDLVRVGVRRTRRAGRRRPARHGAGRRPRRDQGGRRHRRGEGGAGGRLRRSRATSCQANWPIVRKSSGLRTVRMLGEIDVTDGRPPRASLAPSRPIGVSSFGFGRHVTAVARLARWTRRLRDCHWLELSDAERTALEAGRPAVAVRRSPAAGIDAAHLAPQRTSSMLLSRLRCRCDGLPRRAGASGCVSQRPNCARIRKDRGRLPCAPAMVRIDWSCRWSRNVGRSGSAMDVRLVGQRCLVRHRHRTASRRNARACRRRRDRAACRRRELRAGSRTRRASASSSMKQSRLVQTAFAGSYAGAAEQADRDARRASASSGAGSATKVSATSA